MTRDELIAVAGNRSGIYLAVCTEGERKGWRYVGLAGNLAKRLRRHGRDRARRFFANCLRKHPDAFDWSIIEYCPVDRLDERERYYIGKWETNKSRSGRGFNLTDGGDGMRGHKPTAETRAKLSEANKGKKLSADTCAKMSEAQKGRKVSAEGRAKMSEAQKGRKVSAEARANISAANTGRKHTAETRAKIGAAGKGRKHTAEHKAKIGAAQKGRKHTAEHKAKNSAVRKGRKLSAEHCANVSAGMKASYAKRRAALDNVDAGDGP